MKNYLSSSVLIRGHKLYLRLLTLLVAIPSFAAPRLHCDKPKYDFGTVIGKDRIVHEFILKNVGDEPVRISKVKDCCGVVSAIIPMVIPPGSNAVCKSVFTTRNRYGQQDKQIFIASNDRKHPYFELKMTGTLLKPVEVSPRYLRLGDLFPDSEINQIITATKLLDHAVVLESVKSTIAEIRAEVVEETGRSWRVRLSSANSLKVGKLSGKIILNYSSGIINIPVIGTVKPLLQAVPDCIQLSAKSMHPIERLVMVRSGDDREFDIRSAKLIDVDGEVEWIKLMPDRWKLKLTIKPDSVQLGAKLKLETSSSQQPLIEVPISIPHGSRSR